MRCALHVTGAWDSHSYPLDDAEAAEELAIGALAAAQPAQLRSGHLQGHLMLRRPARTPFHTHTIHFTACSVDYRRSANHEANRREQHLSRSTASLARMQEGMLLHQAHCKALWIAPLHTPSAAGL